MRHLGALYRWTALLASLVACAYLQGSRRHLSLLSSIVLHKCRFYLGPAAAANRCNVLHRDEGSSVVRRDAYAVHGVQPC